VESRVQPRLRPQRLNDSGFWDCFRVVAVTVLLQHCEHSRTQSINETSAQIRERFAMLNTSRWS
jgi:hypothetical protein